MKNALRVIPIIVLVLPGIALAAAPTTLKELVGMLVDILNTATVVLIAAALVAFLYGAAYNLIKAGERGGTALREFLVWGVIILFVMVSIWGILNLLQATLFGSGGSGSSDGYGNDSIEEEMSDSVYFGPTATDGSNISF